MSTDPTLASLASFDDPSAWDKVVDGVPIFVPHEIEATTASGTKTKSKVDRERLEKIAANVRRLQDEHGVVTRWTEGHMDQAKLLDQTVQPKILAYGRDARVGTWGPKQLPAILQTVYVRKGCGERFREYPYRSAEFYGATDEITGVALLRTDPKLDMGMLIFGRGDGCTLYQRRGEEPIYLYLETPMADEKPPQQPSDKPPGQPAAAAPQQPPADPPPPATKEPAAAPHDELAVQYQRLRADNEQTRQEVATLREQLKAEQYARSLAEGRAAVERLVTVERVRIPDPAKEAERLAKLPTAAEREERLAELRTCYQRLPGDAPIRLADDPDEGPDKPLSKVRAEAATQYMREQKCSWEDAVKAVREGKVRVA